MDLADRVNLLRVALVFLLDGGVLSLASPVLPPPC